MKIDFTLPNSLTDETPRLVTLVATSAGYKRLEKPCFSNEHACEFCGETKFFTCMTNEKERAWFCGRICLASKLPSESEEGNHPTHDRRSILWPEFCELNGVGDVNHDISFEKVQQTPGKINFLIEFCQKPKGIILMHGDKGTGKTYACLGALELFTRKSKSALFFSCRSLIDRWLRHKEEKHVLDYIKRVSFLVIDDFGTGEPSAAFLEFFFELMDARLQWTDRGTIITTNLNMSLLSKFCGEALADRLSTGQEFIFKGESRRKKVAL